MKALDDLMRSVRKMAEPEPATAFPDKPVDLLLYAPCPVKLAMKEAVETIVAAEAAGGNELSFHIPMGCTSVDPYDPIYLQQDPDKLPGIIASIGFGDFWREEFAARHARSGVFGAALPATVNPLHRRAGLIDPEGVYTVYGTTAYVFMADTRRLAGRPLPRAWEDLLDPRYAGEIVMCGDGDDMADAVALNIYKDCGMDGLRALAANCKGLMHSSAMVMSVGGKDAQAGAIYVIPAFFALSVSQPDYVEIIWPADGAAASPLYFLAKNKSRERLSRLIQFFAGGFAGIPSAAWFAPMDASVPSRLPGNASLKWVGWDFVRNNDISGLRDKLNVLFRSMAAHAQ
jgi:ABC-type Fe3+ transport system substrate-binding protein